MIERAALMPWTKLVNVVLAISAILLVAGCGGDTPKREPGEITTPLVWQTDPLEGDIAGVSIIDKTPPIMAVAYVDGGVDIINFDGERQHERGPIRLSDMAAGFQAKIDGVSLDLFPGIDAREETFRMVAIGEGLIAPVDLDVSNMPESPVKGVCSAPIADETSHMQIAFWTEEAAATLRSGALQTDEGAFVINGQSDVASQERYISTCAIKDSDIAMGGPAGLRLIPAGEDEVVLELPSVPVHVSLLRPTIEGPLIAVMTLTNGDLWIGDSEGRIAKITLSGGIGIEIPDQIGVTTVMTGNGFGGFPNGLIALESLKEGAPVRIQFLELGDVLTSLSALPAA